MQRLSVVGQKGGYKKEDDFMLELRRDYIIHLRHASYPIQEFLKFLYLQGNFYSLRNAQEEAMSCQLPQIRLTFESCVPHSAQLFVLISPSVCNWPINIIEPTSQLILTLHFLQFHDHRLDSRLNRVKIPVWFGVCQMFPYVISYLKQILRNRSTIATRR